MPAEPGDSRSPLGVLRRADVPHRVIKHRPIRHQRDIEEHLDLPVDRSVKTLVFRADQRIVLAVIPGRSRLDYRAVAAAVAVPRAQLRAADEGTLAELGMEPGGASPLCDHHDVTTVFDTTVTGMEVVYCGSGRADQTVEVDSRDLVRLARVAIVAPIAR